MGVEKKNKNKNWAEKWLLLPFKSLLKISSSVTNVMCGQWSTYSVQPFSGTGEAEEPSQYSAQCTSLQQKSHDNYNFKN